MFQWGEGGHILTWTNYFLDHWVPQGRGRAQLRDSIITQQLREQMSPNGQKRLSHIALWSAEGQPDREAGRHTIAVRRAMH